MRGSMVLVLSSKPAVTNALSSSCLHTPQSENSILHHQLTLTLQSAWPQGSQSPVSAELCESKQNAQLTFVNRRKAGRRAGDLDARQLDDERVLGVDLQLLQRQRHALDTLLTERSEKCSRQTEVSIAVDRGSETERSEQCS